MSGMVTRKTAAVVVCILTLSGLLLFLEMEKSIDLHGTENHTVISDKANILDNARGWNMNLFNVYQMEFEPEVSEDFPTVDSNTPRIPHIIHFIFISGMKEKNGIPAFYKANIKAFLHFNPNWTCYFWSEKSARQLISSRQPALLSVWDNYPHVMNKADALRYVLLYEFGGVYADLDIKYMRPLDRATLKYACVLTPEPFEHSAIIFRIPFLISTAIMMCRQKHPFMKKLIVSLPEFANLHNPLIIAGPIFFTKIFKRYNNFQPRDEYRMKIGFESNSPYFYKGSLQESHRDAVYVANTLYFMKSVDSRVNFKGLCNGTKTKLVERGCFLWNRRKTSKTNNSFSYTDHNWAHIYSIKNSTRMIPIGNVIPRSKLKIWQSE